MRVVKVEPIGKRRTVAFVSYRDRCGGLEEIEVDEYPPSQRGKDLRRFRIDVAHLNLREAANALGIGVVELSGLERGSHTFATEAEWDEAMDRLRAGGGR